MIRIGNNDMHPPPVRPKLEIRLLGLALHAEKP